MPARDAEPKGPAMDVEFSQRLQQLPPYLFADLRRKMATAREKGIKVLRIDIGDPDVPTPDPVVEEFRRAVADEADPDRHRYGCDRPAPQFAEAARTFYRRRFGVELASDQLVTTMGAKDAIVKLCLGVMNPGDVGLAPQPGYPTYNIGHVFCGGSTCYVPLRPENGFLMDFGEIPSETLRRARILWLNYPNNPTTGVATAAFFEQAVAFAREHGLLLVHDAAYVTNTYGDCQAPSVLQVPGADEVAVEMFSLSKAFNMTGWRAGFVAGNASAVRALSTVKENVDNGSLRAVQFAAARALDLADDLLPKVNAVYAARRDLVVDALNAAGWSLEKPQATIYVWAPVPEKYAGDSGAFATDLLEKTGVMVTPGRGYGEAGEGYFRISLTYPDDVLREAMDRIVEMM